MYIQTCQIVGSQGQMEGLFQIKWLQQRTGCNGDSELKLLWQKTLLRNLGLLNKRHMGISSLFLKLVFIS